MSEEHRPPEDGEPELPGADTPGADTPGAEDTPGSPAAVKTHVPNEGIDPNELAGNGEKEPRITLDRYYSRRRPAIRSGWTHIVSLVAMLVALVMI
ncbi:MAG: hypothetical protein JRH20_03310, partial [Deltaproteobacteria bacterium]|nr:hypothetical protein [Deltaproteobacteria bacterium]